MILFWLLIHFGTDFYWILSARLISGVTSGAVYLSLVLFSAEVANDNIRGSLTSLSMLSWNIGALIAYILGAFVEYHYIPYICITMPIIFAVIFIMLPNTPRYYLAKGEIQVKQSFIHVVFFSYVIVVCINLISFKKNS